MKLFKMVSTNNAALVLIAVLTIALLFSGLIDAVSAVGNDNNEGNAGNASTPIVETRSAEGITGTSAVLKGYIVDSGGADIEERGFGFGTTCSCSLGWSNVVTVSGNSFSYKLTNLRPDKRYYFRAWARNAKGWSHGDIMVLTTYKSKSKSSSSWNNIPQTAIVLSQTKSYSGEEGLWQEEYEKSITIELQRKNNTDVSCFGFQKCYSTKEEAVLHVPSRVVPKECFVLNDGPLNNSWRAISETACAHWVAHQLGIKHGNVLCDEGYSIRVKDVIFGRKEIEIKNCSAGDIWTNNKVSYCGIVRELKDDEVLVEHDSAIKGGVVEDWFSSGKCWTELNESQDEMPVLSSAENKPEEPPREEEKEKEPPSDTNETLSIIDKFLKLLGI